MSIDRPLGAIRANQTAEIEGLRKDRDYHKLRADHNFDCSQADKRALERVQAERDDARAELERVRAELERVKADRDEADSALAQNGERLEKARVESLALIGAQRDVKTLERLYAAAVVARDAAYETAAGVAEEHADRGGNFLRIAAAIRALKGTK